MEAWLFKTPVGPQAHNLNPLQFYTIKKEEAELRRTVQEAKFFVEQGNILQQDK